MQQKVIVHHRDLLGLAIHNYLVLLLSELFVRAVVVTLMKLVPFLRTIVAEVLSASACHKVTPKSPLDRILAEGAHLRMVSNPHLAHRLVFRQIEPNFCLFAGAGLVGLIPTLKAEASSALACDIFGYQAPVLKAVITSDPRAKPEGLSLSDVLRRKIPYILFEALRELLDEAMHQNLLAFVVQTLNERFSVVY